MPLFSVQFAHGIADLAILFLQRVSTIVIVKPGTVSKIKQSFCHSNSEFILHICTRSSLPKLFTHLLHKNMQSSQHERALKEFELFTGYSRHLYAGLELEIKE